MNAYSRPLRGVVAQLGRVLAFIISKVLLYRIASVSKIQLAIGTGRGFATNATAPMGSCFAKKRSRVPYRGFVSIRRAQREAGAAMIQLRSSRV